MNGDAPLYKVMLVDDEEKARSLLKLMLDWKRLGFEIAAEAGSGQEALLLTDEAQPDLIITDIRMPFMDGLSFAGNALRQHPHIKIIVLTAYGEFEYAKQSIQIGVTDYLLKPVRRDDLFAALSKARTRLDAEKQIANRAEAKIPEAKADEGELPLLERVLLYVEKNHADATLTLSSLATEFHMNSSYLSRVFKQYAGCTMVEYLTGLRVKKAAKLLSKTDKMAYEIADLVGISDPNYFGKCFKKYTGMSVNEYRRLHGRKTR